MHFFIYLFFFFTFSHPLFFLIFSDQPRLFLHLLMSRGSHLEWIRTKERRTRNKTKKTVANGAAAWRLSSWRLSAGVVFTHLAPSGSRDVRKQTPTNTHCDSIHDFVAAERRRRGGRGVISAQTAPSRCKTWKKAVGLAASLICVREKHLQPGWEAPSQVADTNLHAPEGEAGVFPQTLTRSGRHLMADNDHGSPSRARHPSAVTPKAAGSAKRSVWGWEKGRWGWWKGG